MAAIVHGWRNVEKAEATVQMQIVLNKLWIPDVLIDIIKDFLYINAETISRRYYKSSINNFMLGLEVYSSLKSDIYGRIRRGHWAIGNYIPSGVDKIQLQDTTCMTCGNSCFAHTSYNQLCYLDGDPVNGEELELFDLQDIEDQKAALAQLSIQQEPDW